MRTLKSVSSLVQTDCYKATFDLKDVYYSVNIVVLPKVHLVEFIKLKKSPLVILSFQGYRVSIKIDEIITFHGVFENCLRTVRTTIKLIQSLSFMIHPTKSNFIPTNKVNYLGFITEPEKMIVSHRSKKEEDI